jgi:hypothetical protein
MDTTHYSEKKASDGRALWIALGIDSNDVWHTVNTETGTVYGVHVPEEGTPRVVARETYTSIRAWTRHVETEIGWQAHPDADPRRRWFEGAVAA